MKRLTRHLIASFVLSIAAAAPWPGFAPVASAADWPGQQDGSYKINDFRFHDGSTLPELTLGYTTIGNRTGEPVLILHGTTGSAKSMLGDSFAGVLFGPGQPLDASRHYIILPDALGTGRSSKPSDGMRARFPRYNYVDMVNLQHRLVTEHLGIKHLRLVLGNSMGGMHVWMWAQQYPEMIDTAVPMASSPGEMSGRNWITRRLLIDSIRNDPAWQGGDYTTQPPSLKFASTFFSFATNGGNHGLYKKAPTRAKADELLAGRLSAEFKGDANDHLYQWDSSRDYDASPGLEKISARLLVINSADDERNPPELGLLDKEIKRVRDGRVLLIPGSADTGGHGTTMQAGLWKDELAKLLETAPRRAN